jgi:hypothetical protein
MDAFCPDNFEDETEMDGLVFQKCVSQLLTGFDGKIVGAGLDG